MLLLHKQAETNNVTGLLLQKYPFTVRLPIHNYKSQKKPTSLR